MLKIITRRNRKKSAISVKHNKAKRNKAKYACNREAVERYLYQGKYIHEHMEIHSQAYG